MTGFIIQKEKREFSGITRQFYGKITILVSLDVQNAINQAVARFKYWEEEAVGRRNSMVQIDEELIEEYFENVRNLKLKYDIKEFRRNVVSNNYSIRMPYDQDVEILIHDPLDQQGYTLHRHDYYELVYVYRGRCQNRFQNSMLDLAEGTVLLLNPHIMHDPIALGEKDVIFNILISKELFETLFLELMSDNNVLASFITNSMYRFQSTRDYLYFESTGESVADIMNSLVREYAHQQIYHQTIMKSLLVCLFSELSRAFQEQYPMAAIDKESDFKVTEMIVYLQENCVDTTLESFAEYFQYSPSHISKLLKRAVGKSFKELVGYFRLQKAGQYLKDTDWSVTRIAEVTGYADSGYFCKAFRKKNGVSPLEYRSSR